MADNNNSMNQSTPNRPRRNPRQGDFKVNINFDDPYVLGENNNPIKTGQKATTVNKSGFSVDLPQSVKNQSSRGAYVPQNAKPTLISDFAPQVQSKQEVPEKKKKKDKTKDKKAAAKEKNRKKKEKKDNKTQKDKKRISAEEYYINKQKKKDARLKAFIATLVCLLFITVFTAILSSVAISTLKDILVLGNDNENTISVVVEEGDGFDQIFDSLANVGLLKQKEFVKIFCKFRKYDTVKYEPGVYYFETNEGIEAMLEEMMEAKKGSKNVINLTFPEGWTIARIFAKLDKYDVCKAEKLYANLDIVAKQFDFYNKIDSKKGRYLLTEGYLFPDTYQFYIGESASSVLKKLFTNFEKHWTEEYDQRAKELGLSVDQVLTIASIIQREAGGAGQMADISSVIHNRLDSPDSFPNLQCDSTKDYINSLNDLKVFESDYYYQLYLESYNTYSTKGLPPGPICNPGKLAIEAALNPSYTNYYFFAHDSFGQLYLASTADEHYNNKNKILSVAES